MVTIDSLVRSHSPTLVAYATRLTGGDPYTAEDIVQETWVRAWRHLDRLTEDHGSVRGWLMRVTHNVAVDSHRRVRARVTEVELFEQDMANTTVLPPSTTEVEMRVVVQAILRQLPEVHRRTLVEVYLADQTAKSAASHLGVPVGTVKSRVHKALGSLRATVSPQLFEMA